jgi:hypothetical protein
VIYLLSPIGCPRPSCMRGGHRSAARACLYLRGGLGLAARPSPVPPLRGELLGVTPLPAIGASKPAFSDMSTDELAAEVIAAQALLVFSAVPGKRGGTAKRIWGLDQGRCLHVVEPGEALRRTPPGSQPRRD